MKWVKLLECRTEGLNLHTTARIAAMRSTTSVTFSNSHRAPDEVITTFKVTICSCLPSSTLSLLSFLSCHPSLSWYRPHTSSTSFPAVLFLPPIPLPPSSLPMFLLPSLSPHLQQSTPPPSPNCLLCPPVHHAAQPGISVLLCEGASEISTIPIQVHTIVMSHNCQKCIN